MTNRYAEIAVTNISFIPTSNNKASMTTGDILLRNATTARECIMETLKNTDCVYYTWLPNLTTHNCYCLNKEAKIQTYKYMGTNSSVM